MSEPTTTPRETRHRLNRMEAWFTKNRHRLTVQRQDAAERLLDLAPSRPRTPTPSARR